MAETVKFLTDEDMSEMMSTFQPLLEELTAGLLPAVDEADNGKILGVVNGAWSAVEIQSGEDMEI